MPEARVASSTTALGAVAVARVVPLEFASVWLSELHFVNES